MIDGRRLFLALALTLVTDLSLPETAAAEEAHEVRITIRNHRFEPDKIEVPAGRPLKLIVTNADDTPEEFESVALKIERVIQGGKTAEFTVRPLRKNRNYKFFGEFHQELRERGAGGQMIQIGIVVFRETLEVALVAALLLAATRGIRGRGLWFLIGLAGGGAGAGVVALFAEAITEALAGRGQDLFNAAVLSVTVVMVAWTIAWMRKHGATMAVEARDAGERIRSGQAPLYLLAVTIGVAVLRDGSELVVFLSALSLSGQTTLPGILGGFLVGGAAGSVIGGLIYYGVLRAGIKSVFQLAAVLLAMLGAGLAAQAAGFLVSAGWLPPLVDPLWDSSPLLPDEFRRRPTRARAVRLHLAAERDTGRDLRRGARRDLLARLPRARAESAAAGGVGRGITLLGGRLWRHAERPKPGICIVRASTSSA